MASIQNLLEKSYAEYFIDNFDLVLLNKLTLLSILGSFVHINVLKLLWRKYFLKTIYGLSNSYLFCCVVFTEAATGGVL